MFKHPAFQKHKKLIYSQGCAVLAVLSLILAFLRHAQTGVWNDDQTGSFLLFAALLFCVEIKFIFDWLKIRRAETR